MRVVGVVMFVAAVVVTGDCRVGPDGREEGARSRAWRHRAPVRLSWSRPSGHVRVRDLPERSAEDVGAHPRAGAEAFLQRAALSSRRAEVRGPGGRSGRRATLRAKRSGAAAAAASRSASASSRSCGRTCAARWRSRIRCRAMPATATVSFTSRSPRHLDSTATSRCSAKSFPAWMSSRKSASAIASSSNREGGALTTLPSSIG